MNASHHFVYKVLPRSAWESACRAGTYTGSADDARDGFIHLSRAEQLPGTLAKHFRGQEDLIVIQFETHTLGDALRWEVSRGGAEFPHLYAELPTALALAAHPLILAADGVPRLPAGITLC